MQALESILSNVQPLLSSKSIIEPPRNAQALKSVVDSCLGDNYLSLDYIEHFLREPGTTTRAAYIDSLAVGLVMSRKLHDTHGLFDLLNPGYRWGEIRTLCVLPNFRGRGIGVDLVNAAISSLKENGCEKVVTTAWKSDNPGNAHNVFAKMGFEALAELRHYWRLSHGPSNPCPDCGAVCFCSAMVMTKSL